MTIDDDMSPDEMTVNDYLPPRDIFLSSWKDVVNTLNLIKTLKGKVNIYKIHRAIIEEGQQN